MTNKKSKKSKKGKKDEPGDTGWLTIIQGLITTTGIVDKGFDLADTLADGWNNRQEKKLEMEAHEKEVRLAMEQVKHDATITREMREHYLKVLNDLLKIQFEAFRTKMEFGFIMQESINTNNMKVNNWLIEKTKEMTQFRNKQLSQYTQFLREFRDFDDVDRQMLREAAKENWDSCKQSILEDDTFVKEQARIMAKNSDIDLTPLLAAFQELTQGDLRQLTQQTENFKQLEDKLKQE